MAELVGQSQVSVVVSVCVRCFYHFHHRSTRFEQSCTVRILITFTDPSDVHPKSRSCGRGGECFFDQLHTTRALSPHRTKNQGWLSKSDSRGLRCVSGRSSDELMTFTSCQSNDRRHWLQQPPELVKLL